jgi:hypothetical protein
VCRATAPANKPKPNTRFLRNIVKEATNHNTALLAKEAAESKARLERLSAKEERRSVAGSDIRRRQLGQITAHLTGAARKRPRPEEDVPSREREEGRNKDSKRSVDGKRTTDSRHDYEHDSRSRSDRDSRRDGRRSRSRSRERPKRHEGHSERSSRRRSASPSEERHETRNHRHHRSRYSDENTPHRRRTSPSAGNTHRKDDRKYEANPAPASDSDPLEDIIGPKPPPKPQTRGRGTVADASGIDARFSSTYDPSLDLQPPEVDPSNDDWDLAMEAFRDRMKWRQKGEERLRAAGFTDEEVEKWKNGDREKGVGEVKWAKVGEGREWDRGKERAGGVWGGGGDGDGNRDGMEEVGRLKGR